MIDRRTFLGLLGGAASATALDACQRPVACIVPVADRPEDLLPGEPVQYATALRAGPDVCGVLVESVAGRPVKIEGNPKHPTSGGATNAFAQAELWQLFDPERTTQPWQRGRPATWEAFDVEFESVRRTLDQTGGRGLAIVIDETPAPTLLRLLHEMDARWPEARVFVSDTLTASARAGLELLGMHDVVPRWRLDNADVIAAFDCDLLHLEPGALRAAREFSSRRRVSAPVDEMSRLYVVEPTLTVTGAAADHRLPARAGEVELLLQALIGELAARYWLEPPPEIDAALKRFAPVSLDTVRRDWLIALGRDLSYHRGTSLVVAGHRQPPRVHALCHVLNCALRNQGTTVQLVPDPLAPLLTQDINALLAAVRAHSVTTLVMLDTDVAGHAAVASELGPALTQVPWTLHLGCQRDATARCCTWHLPASHALESWGDLRADDGTASIVQPLIAPRYATLSPIELLTRLRGDRDVSAHQLVRATWTGATAGPDVERQFDHWLREGIIAGSDWEPVPATQPLAGLEALVEATHGATASAATAAATGIEIDFHLDRTIFDGRYANNPYLQELPDPLTSQSWGHALLIGPALAAERKLVSGTVVRVRCGAGSVDAPVLVAPGQAPGTIALTLGRGEQRSGRHAAGSGVDVATLRTAATPWFAPAATIEPTGQRQALVIGQTFAAQLDRPTVRAADLDYFRDRPDFIQRGRLLPDADAAPDGSAGQRPRWGLVVDLNLCIGCSACVVACQIENNVPVVGREQAARGRTMHWLRLDRYFEGGDERPRVLFQPMACQHCQQAPCERACPVAASVRSPDGRIDQIYRRCIGARACLASCPYQVRRFNFAASCATGIDGEPALVNPEVSVRDRGVSEKCSYCVQRVNRGTRLARRQQRGLVDGDVRTACQQVCPTRAISFGVIDDVASAVRGRRREPRSYELLSYLATLPATRYQARLFNPNPEIES